MKKLFTLFLFALLAITSAWAADELFYTLECVKNGSNSGYAKYYDVESNGMTWNAPGNQNFSGYWRIGGNSITNEDRDITATSPMGAAISKITVSHNGYSGANITLNSVKLTVSSDKDFANIIDEVTKSPTVSKTTAGTFDFNPSDGKTWTKDAYYKISFNITVTVTSNRGIDLTKIEFFKSATSTTPTLSFGADWDGKTITKYIGEDPFPVPLTMTPEVSGANISYASSDDNIATWEDDKLTYGTSNSVTLDLLKNKQPGQAKLTASYDGYESASFTIDLQKLPDPTFSVTPGSAVVAGTEVTITAPTNCTISYFVNDGAVQSSTTNTVKLTINEATTILACSKYQGAVNTIESEGADATYTIKTLDAIEITGNPIKTTYAPGEAFSKEGLTVTATYSDGSTANVTSNVIWSCDPATFATEGEQTVAVTATYNGKTATESYTVTVTAPSVSSNTYTLVTSTDELVSGAQYVLLTSDGARAASAWNGADKITTVAAGDNTFELNDKVVTTKGTSVNVLTIAASDTKWTITDQNGVKFASSKKNTNITNDNGTVAISFDTDGAVTIVGYSGRQWLYQEKSSGNTTQTIGNYSTSNKDGADYCTLKLYKSGEVVVKPAAHVKNIAEFMALEPNATAIFDNPVVVLYDYSQPSLKKTDGQYLSNPEYIWVKDESGQTNLYLEEAINPTNHQAKYENGDVIPAGFKAVKNYFSDGNFYQALVDIDNKSLLADASHKRLADPVTITFDEFNALQVGSDAHIAKWNNTYVMIPKVTMAADETDKWDKTYFVYQDGVKATSNVFYNKYSDTRNETEIPLTKQGEDARVTMPTSSTIEYNVYGILQVYNNIWEIMPIRFVPYSEQTVTLKELVELGKAGSTDVNTVYTILNDLRGVRSLPDGALPDRVILAKDENGNAVDKVTPAGNSFMINAKSKFDDAATEESVNATAQEDYDQSNWVEIVLPEGVSAANYVDKIITGLSVKGNYTDTTNPRLEASAAPTAGGATGAYTRNAMCPANFMGTSQKCNAEQDHGDFFFMTPKPNECVQVVWAVYNETADAFYIPAQAGSINSHGFKGAFSIDWAYNAGGEITNLTEGGLYQFAAVVKEIEPGPKSPKRKIAYDNGQELSSDYVVYPLNLDANTVTGITETTGTKTVKSVRYFNIMGVELAEPTAGVNIVLTTYTDGTTHSQKILK